MDNVTHAIAWITRELDLLRRAPALNGCEMKPEWAEQIEVLETALEALKYHFPDTTKMVPLTLDQLREMDGRPVWVEDLEKPEKSGWRLIYWDRKKYLVLLAKSAAGYILEDYGETWVAYAYHPAHIDLEAGRDRNVLTNADRIRAMSDEELAKFLCDFRSCDSSEHPCDGCKAEPHCHTGHSGMIDWLSQPAEEE